MALKLNVGLSKKIGQPDYGSLGATCHVEFELDGGFDNGSTEHFQNAVRRAFAACRHVVDAELASCRQNDRPAIPQPNGHFIIDANGRTETPTNQPMRGATSSQVRALHAIANRNRINLAELLGSRHGVTKPEDLSVRDASSLIDYLKSLQATAS